MSRDGVAGCKTILAAEGLTPGQGEGTSVVDGMSKAVFLEGAIKAQFALDKLAGILENITALRAKIESSSTTA
jgi:chemotaxis response regulator CheB